jgi:hypothetical protein
MIGRNACFPNEQAATRTNFSCSPYTQILKFWCVSFRHSATCMLSITRPRFDVENNNVRRYTFGGATRSRERGVSGPKKMTVGCVIMTLPRRNSVNYAVTDETARARVEMVIVSGSAIEFFMS